ncbi:uncharacterized protein LOC111264192 [Varroa jacobsoni]|uniref:uncharacterized protein LOC111264192 n=1 Tax=Varroa jacobsoni TaxID=62625 RepID=UPI000BF6EE31|nr:uncharacterized protein LOC111264192 [Varroa jacobsoni]XP_022695607.1 uncharacterized protein LOC111264192 [Varroa jacobsoni]XP_022695608.1 uncharacterized protein LOC111264192 [Varroa jacobsoni]XP_022695609.1 uncharacterized protein LOC111264192 [Varroa jacobsoni]
MTSPCWYTYPVPEDRYNLTFLQGPSNIINNIALSATLHCLRYERFCYFVADAYDSEFTQLIPFDSCSFSAEFTSLFVPMHASSTDCIVKRIKYIGRPENAQRASLIVIRIPSQSSFLDLVNILGYLQDVQIRNESTCLLLQDQQDKPLPLNVRNFYSVKVYDAFKWGLRRNGEEIHFQEQSAITKKKLSLNLTRTDL